MQQKHLIFVITALLFSTHAWSAPLDSLSKTAQYPYDTNYIKSYRDWFHVTFVGINQQTGISLTNVVGDKNIVFSTNNPFSFGVGLDYEWLTFEYSKSFKRFEDYNQNKGKTQSTSLRLGYTGRRIRINSYYTTSLGYYVKNINDFIPNWGENSNYPRFDNLKNKTAVLSIYYTFKHRTYSNMAALWQLDLQKKSSGSPVIGIISLWEDISSKTPFSFPDSLDYDVNFANIKSVDFKRIGMTAGYMHTFSIKKYFYLHAALIQGLFYSHGFTKTFDGNTSGKDAVSLSIYYRLSAGYNAKRFYAGVLFLADNFVSDISESSFLWSSYSYLRILAGYRFPIRKRQWMKKLFL